MLLAEHRTLSDLLLGSRARRTIAKAGLKVVVWGLRFERGMLESWVAGWVPSRSTSYPFWGSGRKLFSLLGGDASNGRYGVETARFVRYRVIHSDAKSEWEKCLDGRSEAWMDARLRHAPPTSQKV